MWLSLVSGIKTNSRLALITCTSMTASNGNGFQPGCITQVDGKDLTLKLPLAPWEAALGTSVSVPTLAGAVDMKVKPGIKSGQKMRLKGKGMPGGDLFVEIMIQLPPADDEATQQYYRDMQSRFEFNPRNF